jgi:PhnB protein
MIPATMPPEASGATDGNPSRSHSVHVQPYLFFEGRCDEAIDFYRRAVGAEVTTLMRYKDSPDPNQGAHGTGDQVMHASLRIGGATVLVSDGRCQGAPNFQGFALSLIVRDDAEAERRFTALADGGQVHTPLAPTFFSSRFGMLSDRFGVFWMVYVTKD